MEPHPEHFTMSFGDHLDELRSRLIKALIAPVILFFPALAICKYVLKILTRPVYDALGDANLPQLLQVLSPVEAIIAYFKAAFIVAILFSAPLIVLQLWKFIAPGLYKHEQRFVHLLIPSSVVLTIIGAAFLYFAVLPVSLRVLILFGQKMDINPKSTFVEPGPDDPPLPPPMEFPIVDALPPGMEAGQAYFVRPRNQLALILEDELVLWFDARADSQMAQQFQLKTYINFVFILVLAFSVAFQLPLVILLLGWVGLVDVPMLRKGRRYALFGVVITAAMLTPPDVTSQLTLAVPLYCLYEISIILLMVVPMKRLIREPADAE